MGTSRESHDAGLAWRRVPDANRYGISQGMQHGINAAHVAVPWNTG
jgi:hypothetical protein